MGFTPLDGLMMGTRCGSIDPAIVTYLMDKLELTPGEMNDIMNKKSGLLGISGISNDLRSVREASEAGDERAMIAYEMYSSRVKKFIGQNFFILGVAESIVLTAGVGENCDKMRRMIFSGLQPLGIILDPAKNKQRGFERIISFYKCEVPVIVFATYEEFMIARDSFVIVSVITQIFPVSK